MHITKSTEDYLEAILMIVREKGICRSVDVATRLNFSRPSVSVAMKHLTENGYIRRGAEGQLELTPEGYQIAEATLERHNFLTEFFTSIGVSREVAEEDACGMEHSISKESFDRFREWYSGMKNEGTVKEGH